MGIFSNKHQAGRQSGEFRWPFKPTDTSAQPKPRKPTALKIGNPVLIESSKDTSQYADIPQGAPAGQLTKSPFSTSFPDKPQDFEPLFQESYVSPVDEQLPFELSAASAAKFHDYLQDLSSNEPSADNSEHEEEEDVEIVDICENQVAKRVSLSSPGKPKLIHLAPPSTFGSSRSAASSTSDVRVSGFLRSRRTSDANTCDTPFTPASYFDSSGATSPSEGPIYPSHNVQRVDSASDSWPLPAWLPTGTHGDMGLDAP